MEINIQHLSYESKVIDEPVEQCEKQQKNGENKEFSFLNSTLNANFTKN